MKTAETVIRAKRIELGQRIGQIMRDYDHLNDAEFILSKNPAEVRRVVNAYREKLLMPIYKFFLGDGRAYSQIDQLIWQAQSDFDEALKAFDVTPKKARTEKLLTAIRSEYTNRVLGQVENTFRDIVTKSIQFQTLARSAQLATTAQSNLSNVFRAVTIDGKTYDGTKVDNLWQMMTERYGRSDTVRYSRNGSGYNFPMRSYIDMRTQTTAGEVSRMVSAVEASVNEIYTGRISRHGAVDSCSFWEGKIVFYSQVAKDTFIQLHPEYSEAQSWPTLQQVEADGTHMFKPQCKHRILPYPIQFMTEKRARADIEKNTMPRIPEKINETKIVEKNLESRAA